jgi:dTMP kinase
VTVFVVLEGIDGSGKTTQARLLAERLPALCTREPTDGAFGRVLRDAVELRVALDPVTMALGFAADRADHVAWIRRQLVEERSVVCDRYVLSSLAYQRGGGVTEDWLRSINRHAPEPDLTIFVDTPPAVCAARIDDDELFHSPAELERVRANYLAAMSGGEVLIDGDGSVAEVAARVWDAVRLRVGG